jgi:hypothetical protein
LKERNSKEKNEFRKNVIRTKDLVPQTIRFQIILVKMMTQKYEWGSGDQILQDQNTILYVMELVSMQHICLFY